MKGLLIKDFRFLLGQKSSMLIFAGLGLFFLLTGEEVSFGIMYTMLMMSIFSTSSISYDSHENGMAFLLTLPVNKKSYVAEKYLFALILLLSMGGIMAVLALGCDVFGVVTFSVQALTDALLAGIGFGIVMISLMIPIYVIFGPEKARIAVVMIMGVTFAVYYVLTKIFGEQQAELERWIVNLQNMGKVQGTLLVIGLLAGILAISLMITICGLEKKEY